MMIIGILFSFLLTSHSYALFRRSTPPFTRLRAGSTDGLAIDYPSESTKQALVLMDGFCSYHSGYLAHSALQANVAVVYVLSDYLRQFLARTGQEDPAKLDMMKIPRATRDIERFRQALGDLEPVAVYCESDSGLEDAEHLREALQVPCSDRPPILLARRHKDHMRKAAERAGLRVPKTHLCGSLDEAQSVAKDLWSTNPRIVVKPYRGVASESVYLCSTDDELRNAWEGITSSQVFGKSETHDSVLVQEFVEGTEYAIDVVSRAGQHKVVAIWKYDKRPANDASFCYFRTELVDVSLDDSVPDVGAFATKCLDSLGIQYGLSHNEVILPNDGDPVLIEVNCRQHNMDFCPITMSCIGYNALDVTLLSYFGTDDDWARVPDAPSLRAFGSMVHIVNYARGALTSVHHVSDMNELASVLDFEIYEQFATPGSQIAPTIDIRSDAGWVQLINEDKDELEADYRRIVDWMPTMFETIDP